MYASLARFFLLPGSRSTFSEVDPEEESTRVNQHMCAMRIYSQLCIIIKKNRNLHLSFHEKAHITVHFLIVEKILKF